MPPELSPAILTVDGNPEPEVDSTDETLRIEEFEEIDSDRVDSEDKDVTWRGESANGKGVQILKGGVDDNVVLGVGTREIRVVAVALSAVATL